MNPFFIAEISSNHNQDLKRAFEFIDVASQVGCDAVKFQLFKIEQLFAKEILEKSKDHLDRKKWELPIEFVPKLAERCKEKNIKFACTPFYIDAVNYLKPYVDFYKIASYEILWDELLIAVAKTKKKIIFSTGMANLEEIDHAHKVLRNNGCKNPIILHCNSTYPTKCHDANLASIETLRKEFNCQIGWSDHSVSPGLIYRAIHKWRAEYIEFHLDLDGKGDEFKSGHCWLLKILHL